MSLLLIAVGAILRYAITRNPISGVDLPTVGLILMVVGVVGLVLSVLYMFAWTDRRREAPPDRTAVRERERY
jgi:heme/copper-type cytochrome/quinol oxidase subunit 2